MANPNSRASHKITVWDAPTRTFHWMLAGLVVFLWWSQRTDHLTWHKNAGFALIGLLVFRLYWGFFGSAPSRFASFVRGPRTVWRYLRGVHLPGLGHNPLGGWSVAAMLTVLGIEAGLGLFAADEDGIESGPLAVYASFDQAQRAAHWHALVFYALVALVALHVAAVFLYQARGDNLIRPMVTGRRQVDARTTAPRLAPPWSALIGAALACAVTGGLWWLDAR